MRTLPMLLIRHLDWRTRLAAYIAACRGRAFAYGSFDCVLFAAGAIEAQTGIDLRGQLAGRYATHAGAARLLRRHGLADTADLAAHFLPEIPVAAARQGDVAAIPVAHGLALAVIGGPHLLAVATRTGLVARPLTDAVTAFRV